MHSLASKVSKATSIMAETFTSEDEVTSTLEHKETTVIPSGMLTLCMLGNFACFFCCP